MIEDNFFVSIASSSSGNCFLFKQGPSVGLIDAGISFKKIRTSMEKFSIFPEDISFILITHEHKDHTAGLKVLLKKASPKIYVPDGLLDRFTNDFPGANIIPVKAREAYECNKIRFIGFDVFHDSEVCFGYRIAMGDKTIGFATDMGKPSLSALKFLKNSDFLVLESNYDKKMLLLGKYPHFLKKRIISPYGHLDNDMAMSLLQTILHKGLKKVMLAHLSTNNNDPEIVFKRFNDEFGDKLDIVVAKKDDVTVLF